MKWAAVGIGAAVAAAVGGWALWAQFEERQEVKALAPQARLVALHLGSVVAKGKSDGVTFAEYFRHLDQSIAALDQVALQIGAAAPQRATVEARGALQYSANAQEIVRAMLFCSRATLDISTAMKRARELLEDVRATESSALVDAQFRSIDKANAEARELIEKRTAQGAVAVEKVALLKRQSEWVGRMFGSDVAMPVAQVEALAAVVAECK